jgi:hypothetical protein
MKHWNVKRRLTAGFSAAVVIMMRHSSAAMDDLHQVASSLAAGVSPLALPHA